MIFSSKLLYSLTYRLHHSHDTLRVALQPKT